MILSVRGISKNFGGVQALDQVSFDIGEGEIVGIAGPNGSGKTTLFNCISGFAKSDDGHVRFGGHQITNFSPSRRSKLGLARTFQSNRLAFGLSVIENVLLFCHNRSGERLAATIFLHKAKEVEKKNIAQARKFLTAVGLDDKRDALASTLSYGQQKILGLICCIAQAPRLTLLDEPFAGLSTGAVEIAVKLISTLHSAGTSVAMIDHDLTTMEKICSRVLFLASGHIIVDGAMDDVRRHPRVLEAYMFKGARPQHNA